MENRVRAKNLTFLKTVCILCAAPPRCKYFEKLRQSYKSKSTNYNFPCPVCTAISSLQFFLEPSEFYARYSNYGFQVALPFVIKLLLQ